MIALCRVVAAATRGLHKIRHVVPGVAFVRRPQCKTSHAETNQLGRNPMRARTLSIGSGAAAQKSHDGPKITGKYLP
jgi:hypothetical protein